MALGELGFIELMRQADLVQRSTASVLLLMSLASWTVMFIKGWALLQMRFNARSAAHEPAASQGLQSCLGDAASQSHAWPYAGLRRKAAEIAARTEVRDGAPAAPDCERELRRVIRHTLRRLESGLGVLASVGATAPFVGLFGTVWGIYGALVRIGESGQATIDKVAGPVGEALVMTAFGLAVAIPAVLAYNFLVRSNRRIVSRQEELLEDLVAELQMQRGAVRGGGT
jgi:biopolymer transport protein ExbB